jgi:hypothetical protein
MALSVGLEVARERLNSPKNGHGNLVNVFGLLRRSEYFSTGAWTKLYIKVKGRLDIPGSDYKQRLYFKVSFAPDQLEPSG